MSYSDFNLAMAAKQFKLQLEEKQSLFAETSETPVSESLRVHLKEWVPLALAMDTKKARSELIVVPILVEWRRQVERRVNFFSGVELDVDPARGLSGHCDFLATKSEERYFVKAPILAIVEAKNENINAELGQCAATLVGAQIFNQREGAAPPDLFGAVTMGNTWRFLKLEGAVLIIDNTEYYVSQVGKILGILHEIVVSTEAPNPGS